ncbi:reverse transcriptase domain-containing protein [Tanacetum coccineum]
MIVRSPSPYNGIIGRLRIREIQAVPSTAHGMRKFLVNGGVVTIRSTILTPNECATITATSKDSIKKIEGGQKNLKVAIRHDFLDQEVALGGTLSIKGRTTLCALLKRNLDIFAWQPSDMTGAEVQKLVKAGIMREVYYHDWLSNPVMVKKHDDSWRMYVDFTNLNKACLQDCYPLPKIDWKVESLRGYPFKCFLDAYKGYHQIQIAELDEEKTAFHTPHGVYYYTKMLFDLKNARDTYQRLVDKAFKKQVVQNLEVYVNDLVIKTVEGTFLGYMVGPKGIKPCPEKIEAVLQLPSPRIIQEVQSLNGKLAGLNRFQFTASNDEAEYEALLARLRIAAQMGVRNVHVSVDSKLMENQVLGTYIAKEENRIKYLEKVKILVSSFASFLISQVPRSHNKKADALSKIASTSFAHLSKQVLVEVLLEKSIQEKVVVAVVEEEGPTWMTPITEYLKDGVLLDDKKEANKFRIKGRQYELMDGILYRRSFLRLWLRCVGPLQADYVIREIHEGLCSMHTGPRSMVAKAMRSRYYWQPCTGTHEI